MSSSLRLMMLTAAVATMAALVGCAGSGSDVLRTAFVEYDAQQQSEYQSAKFGEYRIQEGDELAVVFSYLDDLNQQGVKVLPDGSVTLPGIDRVVVMGRTVSQADSLITSRYAEKYRSPDLSVLVEESVGRMVYVLGEVHHPGLHPVPNGGIGILSAISVAGGFTEDAKKSHTVLVRMDEQGYLCQEIDLTKFHTIEGIALTGVGLKTYDVVYVPRSKIGDFSYFSKSVLSGLVDMTRIITDVRFIDSDGYRR